MSYSFQPGGYDIAGMELFYKNKAAEGLHLKNRGVFFSSYEKGRPRDMEYRVQPLSKKGWFSTELAEETKSRYAAKGWEYVCTMGLIAIFRAPAGKAAEVYTDSADYAAALKALVKDAVFSIFSIPLLVAVCILLSRIFHDTGLAEAWLVFMGSTWGLLGVVAIILSFEIKEILDAVKLVGFYRRVKNGFDTDRGSYKVSHFSAIAARVLFAAGLAGLATVYFNKPYPMPYNSDGAYITFRDAGIYGEQTAFMDQDCTVTHYVSPFAEYWDTFEHIDSKDRWIYQEIMVLKNSVWVDATVKAFIETATFADEEEDFSRIDVPGMDRVLYSGGLECIAVKGNRVAYITSIFDNPRQLEMILAALAEKWENS